MKKKSILSDIETLMGMPPLLDTVLLHDLFSSYQSPKKKIFDLKEKGYLHQIRRGFYFNLRSQSLDEAALETLANSIYFPSYISLEWALQFYGLIPERVHIVTSVTTLKSSNFVTPLRTFEYAHLNKNRYPVGYITKILGNDRRFLIARPEKALLDYVNLRATNLVLRSDSDIQEFLDDDLRLELGDFLDLVSSPDLAELFPYYHRNSKEHRLLKWLSRKKKGLL
jgi:hypothetical protein